MRVHLILVAYRRLPIPSRAVKLGLNDNLLVGPSSPDLSEHCVLRVAHRGAQEAKYVRHAYSALSRRIADGSSFVVWMDDGWASSLTLALLCAHARPGTSISRVRVPVGDESPKELSAAEIAAGAETWSRFVSSDVSRLLSVSEAGFLPDEAAFGELLRTLLPRLTPPGLSELDRWILEAARATVRACDFLSDAAPGAVRRRTECAGDGSMADRLAAWAMHPPSAPALRMVERARNAVLSTYELTESGASLLGGKGDLSLGVPLSVGGVVAYRGLALRSEVE